MDEMGIVGSSMKDATGDLSSYSYHMADQGTETMDREMAFMFASKSGRLIYHIDEALRRIQDGSFGLCHSCGKPISQARLEAVPHARLCIDCKPKKKKRARSISVKRFLWPRSLSSWWSCLDQITKVWAVADLTDQPSQQVWGDFLRFTLVYNMGGAWGPDLGSSSYYLTVALVILPVLGFYLYQYRNDPYLFSWPLAFIIGGAIGNVMDRIRIGKVVDFIDVDFFEMHIGGFHLDRWWTFNVADASITCALIFLIVVLLFHHPKKQVEPVQETQPTQPTL